MPTALWEARTLLGICREFRVLPSQVLNEPAELLRLLAVEQMGGVDHGERD